MDNVPVLIAQLINEQEKISKVIAALRTLEPGTNRTVAAGRKPMSAAARKKIAAAQRKRWAKVRAGKKS